jgi:hypothetical protein
MRLTKVFIRPLKLVAKVLELADYRVATGQGKVREIQGQGKVREL